MRIAVAQIDSVIGDFSGNAAKIRRFVEKAAGKADLVVFPELCLCGYPPMDLLDQTSFVDANLRALRELQRRLPKDIAVGIGFVGENPRVEGKGLANSYGILTDGALAFRQDKTLLPTYDVFDEARYFEPAVKRKVFAYGGRRIGIAICEDLWKEATKETRYGEDPIRDLLDEGADLIIVPSASPYYANKHSQRLALAAKIVARGSVPVIYANAVGANDSLIFDGRSFVAAPNATPDAASANQPATQAAAFKEDLLFWDDAAPAADLQTDAPAPTRGITARDKTDIEHADIELDASELDTIEDALVLGIADYMKKCGFSKAHLGLSGGIDSALVAYLATKAAGSANVVCFGLPSRFSSDGSKDDARELAENLGLRFVMLPIEDVFKATLSTLESVFESRPFDLAEENLQARIRGTLLMAYSNKFDSLLLATGNKSELAMGYCTLYGDMCGALAPIGDLFKVEVFSLCRRINERSLAATGRALIPPAIIAKPPSAELRPNQVDQDSLPPYDQLDDILSLHILDNLSLAEIVARGRDPAVAARVLRTLARSEYKRRQAAPVLKVSQKAFGLGRRLPIASKFN